MPQSGIRVLNWQQRTFNYMQRSARSSVEHFNQTGIRRHKLFGDSALRHSIETITNYMHCVCYAEATARKLSPPRAGFGSWPHNLLPAQIDDWNCALETLINTIGRDQFDKVVASEQ